MIEFDEHSHNSVVLLWWLEAYVSQQIYFGKALYISYITLNVIHSQKHGLLKKKKTPLLNNLLMFPEGVQEAEDTVSMIVCLNQTK